LIEKGLQAGLDQQTVVAVLWIMRLYDLVRVQTSSTRPLGTQMDAEDADSPYSSAHSAPPR
jgi:hypothetical protein